MRIYLATSKNTELVPFAYQQLLTGVLHKWLGKNDVHDEMSLYSFCWLKNGKASAKGINFPNGASFFISTYDNELLKKIIEGIQQYPELFYGMKVTEITIQEDPQFSEIQRFVVASPVFIKRSNAERKEFFYYNHPEAGKLLTETLAKKLQKAGLNAESISVEFDKRFRTPSIKGTSYYGIHSKGSVCPVIIKGTPQQIAFAWNVGLGNSTGIGFGALN
ncbi:MAG: CRISPR-associated endoribonuclease Cas6 [Cytophaga sp.]|uniref:CRISPR-associated endoribonuclease Cas6 n=1 Tax=Cytophaga sp. TaxID=29535 RepID=UPI003F7FA5B3